MKRGNEMAKPDYIEVNTVINDLVAAYRKADEGYEYAAATGNLSAILGSLICGDLSRAGAFAALQDAVARVEKYSK